MDQGCSSDFLIPLLSAGAEQPSSWDQLSLSHQQPVRAPVMVATVARVANGPQKLLSRRLSLVQRYSSCSPSAPADAHVVIAIGLQLTSQLLVGTLRREPIVLGEHHDGEAAPVRNQEPSFDNEVIAEFSAGLRSILRSGVLVQEFGVQLRREGAELHAEQLLADAVQLALGSVLVARFAELLQAFGVVGDLDHAPPEGPLWMAILTKKSQRVFDNRRWQAVRVEFVMNRKTAERLGLL